MRNLIAIFLLLFSLSTYGQALNDTITLVDRPVSFKHRMFVHDEEISYKELKLLLSNVPEALEHYKLANQHRAWGGVTTTLGAFGIGYTIGTLFIAEPINWPVLVSSAALFTIGLRFVYLFDFHLKKSVRMYNAEISHGASTFNLKLGLSNNGLGIFLSF